MSDAAVPRFDRAARARFTTAAALIAILILAAALRLPHLGVESLWGDEALSVQIARLNLVDIIPRVIDWEQIPPVHHLLLHFWIKLFGTSEASLRMPSALAGVAAVGMTFALVRGLGGRPFVALASAALLAVSPMHLAYSRECRAYSLHVLLAVTSCWLFARLLARPAGRRTHAAYVVVAVLLLYSHLYGMFVLAAQHLTYAVLYWRDRRRHGGWSTGSDALPLRPRPWFTDNLAVAALFAPWVPVVLRWTRTVSAGFWVRHASFDDIPRAYWTFAGSRVALFGMVALVVLAVVRDRRDLRERLLPLALMLVPVIVPVTVTVLTRPSFAPRYAIAACVGLSIVAATGAAALPGRVLPALAVGLMLIVSPRGEAPVISRDRWRELGQFLNQNMRAGDLALPHPGAEKRMYDYYVNRPDCRRTGIDPARLPVTFPLEGDRHLWLIYVYEPWYTVNQFITGEPVRIGRRMRTEKVLVLELLNAPPGEHFGRNPATMPAETSR